jgi:hypothetical protein
MRSDGVIATCDLLLPDLEYPGGERERTPQGVGPRSFKEEAVLAPWCVPPHHVLLLGIPQEDSLVVRVHSRLFVVRTDQCTRHSSK